MLTDKEFLDLFAQAGIGWGTQDGIKPFIPDEEDGETCLRAIKSVLDRLGIDTETMRDAQRYRFLRCATCAADEEGQKKLFLFMNAQLAQEIPEGGLPTTEQFDRCIDAGIAAYRKHRKGANRRMN